LTINNLNLREFCSRIKELGLKFSLQARADVLDEEIIYTLKDSGCYLLLLGIESADDNILKSMKKGISFSQIANALRWANEAGLPIYGNFIFGDIEENMETASKTLNWWKEHPEINIYINLGMIVLYPGSQLYKYAIQRGMIKDKLQYLKDRCPYINVSKLTGEQYIYFQTEIEKLNSLVRALPAKNVKVAKVCIYSNEYLIQAECAQCGSRISVRCATVLSQTHWCQTCFRMMSIKSSDFVDFSLFATLFQKSLDKLFMTYSYDNKKIIVFGMGKISTGLVLFSKELRKCIVGFTGADYAVHQGCFLGFATFDPKELTNDCADYILIASTAFALEIRDTIENELKLSIPIIDISKYL
jgi:hypothetical protein